jgi:hypothetical protein
MMMTVGLLPQFPQQIQAVLLLEHQVQQQDVRIAQPQSFRHLAAVGRREGVHALRTDVAHHDLSHGLVIVDHEHRGAS